MAQDEETEQVATTRFKCFCNNPLANECHDDQNWQYKMCNATRHYLFTRCRYPAFTDDYIKRHVDKPDTSPEDLQAYMENHSGIRRNKALILVCVYLTYCLKNLIVPLETIRMFNYDDLESNIRLQWTGGGGADTTSPASRETVKLFTCLATNCSHLSPAAAAPSAPSNNETTTHHYQESRLARDIAKLPIFKLCHPTLNYWYSPISALDSLGVLMILCVCFNGFLLGSWITIQQLIFPARDELIMFIVAPAVTARMTWRRTRELLASVSTSYAHFCLNNKLRFFTQTEHEYLFYSARLARLESTASWSSSSFSSPIGQRRRRRHRTSRPRHGNMRQVDEEQEEEEEQEEPNEQTKSRALKPLRSDEELDRMTNECLPIIRTCWWRKTITNIFLSTLATAIGNIIVMCVLVFKYIFYRLAAKHEQLAAYASEMRRQDCQLWYARDQESEHGAGQRELIDLSRLELKWTTFSRLEGCLFNIMPAVGVSMMFACYWSIISEIEIWLAELRTLLVASLVISRFKLAAQPAPIGNELVSLAETNLPPPPTAMVYQLSAMRSRANTSASIGSRSSASATSSGGTATAHSSNRTSAQHFYNMNSLRQQFKKEISNIGMAYFTRFKECRIRPEDGAVVHASGSSMHDSNGKMVFKMREIKFTESIAIEQYRDQCEHAKSTTVTSQWDEDNLAHDIYTMEQVYVNFRLFVEHVHGLAPSMGVVLVITYLLNFGLVCISVMCSRKFADLRTEMMFIVVFGWLVSNILILLSANFHANAKKLQPLMWSIIAQLTHSQDNRVKHLRFLWLKQVQILDNQAGLALDAFGLRVTYVNIIQIIIWTVTIIVMALKL